MPTFIEFSNFLANGNLLTVGLVCLFILLKNPKDLIQTYSNWKSSKVNALELALKNKNVKGPSRALLEDQLEQKLFYSSTGLNLERPIRDKIIQIHAFTSGAVKFQHFVRAKDQYLFDDNKLSIRWGLYERIFLWFYGLAFFISLFSFIFVYLISVTMTDSIDLNENIFTASALLITGGFYLYSWAHLVSANIVRKEIMKFYNLSTPSNPNSIVSNF